MTKEQTLLLYTVARIVRAHLRDHMEEGPEHKYSHDDWKELNEALKPFDPNYASAINEQEGRK